MIRSDDIQMDKENEDVNTIVQSVVNTIRDLSAKLGGKCDELLLRACPICGDQVTGEPPC